MQLLNLILETLINIYETFKIDISEENLKKYIFLINHWKEDLVVKVNLKFSISNFI